MYATELNSFIHKFHQLCNAGLTAHLDLDSQAGNVWIGLRVQVGPVPPPARQPHVPQHQPRYRGPSYQRRQERRHAAFDASASTLSNTEQVDDKKEESSSSIITLDAEKADNEEQGIEVNLTDEASSSDGKARNNISAEKAGNTFHCELCDFESIWENGLKVHVSRKHRNIEQLDSGGCCDDVILDEKYMETENYWKCGKLGTIFQSYLDANEILEKSDLTEEEKVMEKNKVLEARKFAFGTDYIYVPPWKSR